MWAIWSMTDYQKSKTNTVTGKRHWMEQWKEQTYLKKYYLGNNVKPELSEKIMIPSLLKDKNPNIMPVVWMSHPNLVKICVIVYESTKDGKVWRRGGQRHTLRSLGCPKQLYWRLWKNYKPLIKYPRQVAREDHKRYTRQVAGVI